MKTSDDAPTVTVEHWQAAKTITDVWRTSAHRLLEQLDKSGKAVVERRLQDRVLMVIREAGAAGVAMRDLYRKLNLSAKQARQLTQDLIRAGLIEERRIDRAEAYIAADFLTA